MEEWKEYKLGDVLTIKYGKDHKHLADGNIPIYGSGGIMRYGERSLFEGPSILIPRKGSLNNVMYADKPFWTVDTMFWTIINENIANPLFVYYSICKKDWASFNVGSAVPSLTVPVIEDIEINLPPKSVQNAIATILKSLDDKIEVNRQLNDNFAFSLLILTCFILWLLKLRNDNLLKQAQALFKAWFVDFEPFRCGEFVETELGLIPKEWKLLSFKDFIVALTEKAPVDSLPEYSVTNNGIIPRDTKFNKKLSKSSSMNKVLRKDNLVFGMSREILNWGIMEDEIGGVSSAYNIYKIDDGLVNPTYLRLYMKAKIAEFNSLIGTAAREGQSLDKGQLMQKKIYVPTEDILQDFFAHYVPIMEAVHNAEKESCHLAQLRDALLPKLMSCELKIS